jgi:glycosyltransferase involved in cell wall biosynthesis
MPAPLLLDLSHTSHTHARTGIQRVARSLHAALGSRALAITHDPYASTWRALEPWERATLSRDASAHKRGARWPLVARLRGRARRAFRSASAVDAALAAPDTPAAGLIVPELFSATVARAFPPLFAAVRGPRIALFHDAIALKLPELTPEKTVARFPAYLRELLAFDGIAAVSEDSRASLLDYWRWLGAAKMPAVRTIPLGLDTQNSATAGEIPPPAKPPVVLCVASIEGRKNHLALLEACESLWARGEKFTLHLIGLAQPQTAARALARIDALRAAGRPLRYDGPVTDAALATAYRAATFTVYPSLLEGFGLPVLESLAHGLPCICSARGALGESARDGGCVALERVDSASLAQAIGRLLASPAELAALAANARARPVRSWSDYAAELCAWLAEISRA